MKCTNWVDNHQMILTAKYGSHHFTGYEENAILPFFHYKSMGAFCCHGNQTKRQITIILAILNCPHPSNICTNLVILLQWFWRRCHLKIYCCHGNRTKWPLVIKHINWVDNHPMIISAKYSLNHFNGYEENAI